MERQGTDDYIERAGGIVQAQEVAGFDRYLRVLACQVTCNLKYTRMVVYPPKNLLMVRMLLSSSRSSRSSASGLSIISGIVGSYFRAGTRKLMSG